MTCVTILSEVEKCTSALVAGQKRENKVSKQKNPSAAKKPQNKSKQASKKATKRKQEPQKCEQRETGATKKPNQRTEGADNRVEPTNSIVRILQ